MKAALMYGSGDIRVEEISKPECPKGGLILKVVAVGLCGSDIRNMTTDSRKGKYPHVFGHETVGIVEKVDEAQNKYKVGDRLYVYPEAHCLHCEYCRSGHNELCDAPVDVLSKQGSFADYIAISAEQIARDAIFPIPDGVDYQSASLGEPLSSVYACQENINIGLGDTVVIIGAGPIGCFHSQLAKLRGAKKVIMIEINNNRLRMARDFGVDEVINSTEENPIEAVKRYTDGNGADKVISANPSTMAQSQSVFMVKKGGTVVFFGGVPKGELTEINSNYIHYNGIWIYGHYGANSMQVQKSFELAISDRFPTDKFITHVLPLSEINKGIALMKTGEAIKVVILPDEK